MKNIAIFLTLLLIPIIANADVVTITGIPTTSIMTNQTYSFKPTATSNDKKAKISFSITNNPSWIAFNTTNGAMSGVPTVSGYYPNIVITARSNKGGTASLAPFAITVTQPNSPPVVNSVPNQTNVIGDTVSLQVVASDPNGDAITFSSSTLPLGLAINSTGLITGKPTTVGSYNVTVTVVDSKGLSSTTTFWWDIVNIVVNNTATISWIAPTTNTDGTALTDLAGYKVYYSQDSTNVKANVVSAGNTITSVQIGNLALGTWYFVVSALNSSGAESSLSNVASKTF